MVNELQSFNINTPISRYQVICTFKLAAIFKTLTHKFPSFGKKPHTPFNHPTVSAPFIKFPVLEKLLFVFMLLALSPLTFCKKKTFLKCSIWSGHLVQCSDLWYLTAIKTWASQYFSPSMKLDQNTLALQKSA